MPVPCSFKGCTREGLYPAPQSPDCPRPYRYFCLEHIRLYNAQWDNLKGLDEKGIEKRIREATVWERPTWPFGKGPLSHKKSASPPPALPPQVLHSLSVLGLSPPVTVPSIKRRFRTLAKEYHPDANQGKTHDLPRFYAIQEAFGTLLSYYAKKSPLK
ncbi:MAG: J domain-containing protein [Bdellovibrionales bacterium]